METQINNVNTVLKVKKTKVELSQAISNLTKQNDHGQYDERIALYQKEYEQYESFPVNNTITTYKASSLEVAAIMGFNKDKRFSITE